MKIKCMWVCLILIIIRIVSKKSHNIGVDVMWGYSQVYNLYVLNNGFQPSPD